MWTFFLHVIDASDPNHEEHEKVVLDILKDLDMIDIPRLAIYNKMDVPSRRHHSSAGVLSFENPASHRTGHGTGRTIR